MRLMFVYYIMKDAGSAQDIHHYSRRGPRAGTRGRVVRAAGKRLGFPVFA